MDLHVETTENNQIIDITDKVLIRVNNTAKAVTVCAIHMASAITTANLDPGTDQDLLDVVRKIIPTLRYRPNTRLLTLQAPSLGQIPPFPRIRACKYMEPGSG